MADRRQAVQRRRKGGLIDPFQHRASRFTAGAFRFNISAGQSLSMFEQRESLVDLLEQAVARRPDREVLRFKQGDEWTGITGNDLRARVRSLAAGLHARGIKKGDAVALLAEGGPLWTITDFAVLSLGAINIPFYPTQAIQQIEYILEESAPVLLVISGERLAKRISPVLDRFPHLPLASFETLKRFPSASVLEEIEQKGADLLAQDPGLYDRLASQVKSTDLASIIYTSGTTGEPKGVMLTHSNIVFNATASGEYLSIEDDNIMLSFLPLSHVFERMVLYLCLRFGVQINYAGGLETIASDLQTASPTLMSTVPRMLERVYARAKKAASESKSKRKIFDWAMRIARQYADRIDRGQKPGRSLSAEWSVADRLVYTKLRALFGGRMKRLVSGGAALPRDMALAFNGAGIAVLQGYGLTETAPVIAVNTLEHNRIGTVGRPLPGVEVRIAEDGEILTRGPHVFQGYFKKEIETEEAFVEDTSGGQRWFKTGDVGYLDGDGFLVITDRKKDLIKTSGGKYVAPQLLESRLAQSEFVEQALIIGNNRKYVSALLVPDFEVLRSWVRKQGLEIDAKDELVREPRVIEHYKSEVSRLTGDLADYERVKRIALLPDQFSVESGELTHTLKARRNVIQQKYEELIDSMYRDGGGGG